MAKLNGTLSSILIDSEDSGVVELALAAMTHANRLALWASNPLPRSTLDSFLIPALLSNVLTFLRQSNLSYTTLSHAIDLVVTPAQHYPEAYTAIESLVPLLASLARCVDAQTRAISVAGILRLPIHEASREETMRAFHPRMLMDALHNRVPEDTRTALVESRRLIGLVKEYHQTMCQAEHAFAPCTLGRKVADLIQSHHYCAGQNPLQTVIYGRPGVYDVMDL